MKQKLKTTVLALTALFTLSLSVNAQNADDKSTELLDKLVTANGGYKALAAQKDVQYKYVYDNFDKGKDVSIEKYIFEGEQSWATYEQHDINVLPGKEGVAVQSLVDEKPTLTLAGAAVTDPQALGGTTFLRKANYYWFTMMYKLKNPGTNYKYLGTEEVDGVTYDKVSLTYDSATTKKEQNDEYILFFNPETHLVDQFLFSLPAFKVDKPILKMTLKYEDINGVKVATLRKGFMPTEDGSYTPIGVYTSSDVKFNNGFTKADFLLK